jgi:hypothetical protein
MVKGNRHKVPAWAITKGDNSAPKPKIVSEEVVYMGEGP